MISTPKLSLVKLFSSILLVLLISNLAAQEKGLIQSKYYSTKDYDAGTQNWAIAQDNRGVLYFGNVRGVLEYDGETWRLIPVANSSTVRSLAFNDQGILFVGAFAEMGFMLPNKAGDLQYQSLLPLINKENLNFGEIWDITCYSDTVFFLSDRYLFRYCNGKIDCWESKNERFYLSHKINTSYLVQEMGVGLLKFENNTLQPIEKGDFFSNIRIHTIFQMDVGLLICSRTEGLFIYDNTGDRVTVKPLSKLSAKARRLNNYFIENSFYHGIELSDNLFALGTISGNILIIDNKWNVIDIINEESIGTKSSIHFIHYQRNHSLWLALANGISQVEVMSPLRYWNEDKGLIGVITDVAKLDDVLYISTGAGIFYTKGSDFDEFSLSRFSPVNGKFEQSWGFTFFNPDLIEGSKHAKESRSSINEVINKDTILLAGTSMGLFQLVGSESILISDYTSIYRLHQGKNDPSKLVLGLSNGLALLTYKNGKWIDNGTIKGIEGNIRDIDEDSDGNLWLSASYKGLYKISNPYSNDSLSTVVELFDTSHGLPTLRSISIVNQGNRVGFYADGKNYTFNDSLKIFTFFNESPTNDSTIVNNQYVDTLSWKRVDSDVISNYYVVHVKDTIIWFATNEGIFRHNGGTPRNYFDLPPTLIRKVILGDSILFNGTNFDFEKNCKIDNSKLFYVNTLPVVDMGTVLNFKNNSLTFYYAWPFFEADKPKLYSYQLIGYDHHWSEWSSESKKEYTNLPEGDYIFVVKAKNLYDIESTPCEFKFTILPPWYRTYFAYLGYFIISILFIILIVKLYTYRLIKEKEKLEETVKERTQEILMQNEEILVQAEHLKEANDWISAKNTELESQKNELEKKKNQLEVSNATKNKFFRIIAHDLRNPISTLVGSTGYILTDIDEFDKEKTKRIIKELNKLSLTTYNLLENLLDWSTNQMGEIRYNPKPLDIVSIINENIELIKVKVNSKDIDLSIDLPDTIYVFADENMLHTVVRNLLSNAVKFTNEKGTIKIFSSVDDEDCSLSITDNGLGISKENQQALFKIEKHYTTLGTHNEKGSGLGLILCKEFIERNGGTITVKSEPKKGSTFTITLKLA
jgi:signal transduction histidine kinase